MAGPSLSSSLEKIPPQPPREESGWFVPVHDARTRGGKAYFFTC